MSSQQTECYRQAAEDALGQLDWCIGYLHGIRAEKISAAPSRNRSYIRRELLQEASEPLPSQAADGS